jgi:uncharacterized membrane protein
MQLRLARFQWLFPAAAGLLLLAWLAATPPGLLGKADAIAYAVCHRIASHSLFIDERQFPFCARCTGMYLGALLGLGYSFYQKRKAGFPPRHIQAILAFFVLAFLVDGVNSFTNIVSASPFLYPSTNELRLLTGAFLGAAVGIYLASAFKQAVWTEYNNTPALGSYRQLAALVGLSLFLDLLVLSNNPLLLIPLALLSAVGVLAILTLAYSMVWTLILKRDNQARSWRGLWLTLTAGFSTGLLQIALVEVLRLALTGTWAGFSI